VILREFSRGMLLEEEGAFMRKTKERFFRRQ
jgi:hypothetical protein